MHIELLLIPLLPFIGFLVNGLARNILPKQVVSVVACTTLLLSFVLSAYCFFQVGGNVTNISQNFFNIIELNSFKLKFTLQVDRLVAVYLMFVTGIGFFIHLYSSAYMHEESSHHYARYFSYLNLFVFSMIILIMGGNLVMMFVGWEGVGLCSFLLIGFWYSNPNYVDAAKKAFVMNRIGDLCLLIALFWIIQKIGSTSFVDIQLNLNRFSASEKSSIALLLFIGATGKSAQLPLFTWLPDAMAGPTPVSALIHAATMVTAGIYLICRTHYFFSAAPHIQDIIAITGLLTALIAATIATKQSDIKKILAYSTVSQLGFMFLALGVGAYSTAVFHVITHAFFKALLFLGAGSVIHAMHHEQDIFNMGGLRKYLPQTHITFLIGCLAIAGVPPFSGFFSKDEILAAAFFHNPIYYVLALFTAILTAFYMFRLYTITFWGEFKGGHEKEHHLHESPVAMTIPLWVLAVFAIFSGAIGLPEVFTHSTGWLSVFIDPSIGMTNKIVHSAHNETSDHATMELTLMAVTTLLSLAVILVTFSYYKKNNSRPQNENGFSIVLKNKWYLDELYGYLIVKPVEILSIFSKDILENKLIDGAVNGMGRLVDYFAYQVKFLQSGVVTNYITYMVVGLLMLTYVWINDTTIINFLLKTF